MVSSPFRPTQCWTWNWPILLTIVVPRRCTCAQCTPHALWTLSTCGVTGHYSLKPTEYLQYYSTYLSAGQTAQIVLSLSGVTSGVKALTQCVILSTNLFNRNNSIPLHVVVWSSGGLTQWVILSIIYLFNRNNSIPLLQWFGWWWAPVSFMWFSSHSSLKIACVMHIFSPSLSYTVQK